MYATASTKSLLFWAVLIVVGVSLVVLSLSGDTGDEPIESTPGPTPAAPLGQVEIPEETVTDTVQPPRVAQEAPTNPEILLALGGGPRSEKCTIVDRTIVLDDGTQVQAIECVYETARPRHPYADYDSETLEQLAYGDAYAALVYARRIFETDPAKTMDLIRRSAALLQDGTPLVWLATVSYGDVASNDVANVSDIEMYYVLASMANRLPNGRRHPDPRFRATDFHALTDDDVQRLDAIVDSEFERMKRIRLEVTGQSD